MPGDERRRQKAYLDRCLSVMRWIQRYAPGFEKRWNRFARPAGPSWRVDETYVKIKGRWTYLYRAVDKEGKTVDFLLRAKRDVAAAKAFFRRAIKSHGRRPRAITLDRYQASIGRRAKSSANIGAAAGPKYGPRST
jgi:transposase-like protein